MTGKPKNTVLAKVTPKNVSPSRSGPGFSSFAVTKPITDMTINITKKLRVARPSSARSISMSVFITEYRTVNTSRTFITTPESRLLNSGPVTPNFAQTKPTTIMNTNIPIWDIT